MLSNFLSCEVKKAALALCDGLAGSRSNEFRELIASNDWDALVNSSVNPNDYSCPESYFRDAAALSFLKKYEALPTKIDKKANAIEKFWKAERNCFRSNQRLLPFIHNTYVDEDESCMLFLKLVREEVVKLIGERPPSNPQGRFGPGATYGDRGGLTTIPDKMQSRPQITHGAWAFLVPWGGTLWAKACSMRDESICFIDGNRFTTVPKDAKNDRGISIEPSLNLFYQLAFGRAMRESLKKSTAFRVDLEHAQTIHRQVAREASITGAFATIDLSQASDTICSALVRLALPDRWYEVLNDLRSPITEIVDQDGTSKKVRLEKFSSMGNGYTFELETVIFMAVCAAVMRSLGHNPKPGINLYVFGDDIIVPTQVASEVISALRYLGMETNKDKTFITGPFRESCGGDYFLGVDVRPYYQKKEVNEPQHFIGMANGIRRMAFTGRSTDLRWHRVRRAWFIALDSIPDNIKHCRGPSELGDLVIHDETSRWETKWRRSIRYIRCYRPAKHREVKWQIFDPDVILAGATYGCGWGNGAVRPRDSVTGYKVGWVPFS